MKQIFMDAEKEPLLPLPHRAVQGVGLYWLFSATSRDVGHGFEAVMIRVRLYTMEMNFIVLYITVGKDNLIFQHVTS
jgi:hypothetical protein